MYQAHAHEDERQKEKVKMVSERKKWKTIKWGPPT